MCNPLQEEQNVQQVQVPIVVQAEQNEVEQVQAVQQAQAVEQEQQVQQVQQEQHPAAPVDAAPAKTQDKVKKEPVARIDQKKVRANYSDERKNAFQANLLQNYKADVKLGSSKQYKAVMEEIGKYASMDLESTKTDKQSAVLAKVRKMLRSPMDLHAREYRILDRYRLYFDTFADGQLEVPEDMTKAKHMDYSKTDFKLKSLTMGLKPSWTDVKDQPLFAHEPSVNDIQQRALGDCYLQAAISSLVLNTPEKLKECLRDNGDGTVTVRFFQKTYESVYDLPAHYQEIIEQDDPMKLSERDLLVRLFVNWKRKSQNALYQFLERKKFALRRNLEKDPAYAAQKKTLDDALHQEKDEKKRDELRAQLREMQQKIFDEAATKTGLEGLNGSIDMDHIPQAEALADYLCAQQTFAPVLEAIGQAKSSGKDVMQVLEQVIDRFEAVSPLMTQLREQKKELFDTLHEDVPMHPVYVTVQKTVPRLFGADAYTANSLWMQMIEKAYAASGLHIDDIAKRASGKRRYKYIVGGQSASFLETLTGVPRQVLQQSCIVPVGDFIRDQNEINPLIDVNEQQKMQQLQIDPEVYALVMTAWEQELKQRYMSSYTKKKEKDKPAKTVEYAVAALTIEDIRETLLDWRNWKVSEAARGFYDFVKDKYRQDISQLDDQMRKLCDYLENYYDNLDASGFEHRRFSTKDDGTPKYTQWALKQYDLMQKALQNGTAVAVGTKRFIPKELKGKGLNGESVDDGLAQGHAYSVVGCEEIDGLKYVTLRNPWASYERKYTKVTEKDGRVHYEISVESQKFMKQSDTSGTFNMELNDFMCSISKIYM